MPNAKNDVSEVYSPPRVTAATKLLPELRLLPGFALDLTTKDTDGRVCVRDESYGSKSLNLHVCCGDV